jgi:hypothetical protein
LDGLFSVTFVAPFRIFSLEENEAVDGRVIFPNGSGVNKARYPFFFGFPSSSDLVVSILFAFRNFALFPGAASGDGEVGDLSVEVVEAVERLNDGKNSDNGDRRILKTVLVLV